MGMVRFFCCCQTCVCVFVRMNENWKRIFWPFHVFRVICVLLWNCVVLHSAIHDESENWYWLSSAHLSPLISHPRFVSTNIFEEHTHTDRVPNIFRPGTKQWILFFIFFFEQANSVASYTLYAQRLRSAHIIMHEKFYCENIKLRSKLNGWQSDFDFCIGTQFMHLPFLIEGDNLELYWNLQQFVFWIQIATKLPWDKAWN